MHPLFDAVIGLGRNAQQFDPVAQFIGELDIQLRDPANAFDVYGREIHFAAESDGGQDRQFVGGIDTVDVEAGIGLGEAQALGVVQHLGKIQALVAPSPLVTPRRAVVGWDSGRLAMVLAVLEARAGMSFAGRDVYLNVAGGLRITEPAADLAVAAALISSVSGIAVPGDAVVFGEIGLSGEVRAVSQADARLKEAAKLGFERAITPKEKGKSKKSASGLNVTQINRLSDLLELFGGGGKVAQLDGTRAHHG